jgi:hypothetical protein
MPLLPNAHATSLLRRDDAGRTIFSPHDDDSCYLVPDGATAQRILHRLRRIRLAQLAAWILGMVALITVFEATHSADMEAPKWLFPLGFVAIIALIEFLVARARGRLARALVPVPKDATEPSLIEKVRVVATILAITTAVGLALYLGRVWPLHALGHADEFAHVLLAWAKAVTKITIFGAGAATVLWMGIRALTKRLRPSNQQAGPLGIDESK